MASTEFHLPASVALVTGASSGIGRQTAEQFAAAGIDTVICSREQENVDPVAEAINDSSRPGQALAVECDVTDREAVDNLVDRTVAEFGGLDVLVNNAGAAFMCEFDELSQNAWQTIVDINLNGVYNCTHAAHQALQDGGGSVVNLSSIRGQEAAPGETHYAAAKAGVINLTQSLATEWAAKDVRVNCVAPGFIATESAVSAGGVDPETIDRDDVDRRIGRTEEVADVIEFLVSDAASFMTGEVLTVRGVPTHSEKPE